MNPHKAHKIYSALLLIVFLCGCTGPVVKISTAQEPITSESISEIITRYRQEIHQMCNRTVSLVWRLPSSMTRASGIYIFLV